MLYSSVVLYLLGARKANDIDLYIHNVPSDIQDKLKIFKEFCVNNKHGLHRPTNYIFRQTGSLL